MAQEALESVNVTYCAKCTMPVEYCRYADKATYKKCLVWLQQKKQKSLLEERLSVDEELAADLEKLALEEEKADEATESQNNQEEQSNTNDNDDNDPEEKSPHDPTKQPSKSILKKDENNEDNDEDDDDEEDNNTNNNNNNNNNSDDDEDNSDKEDPLLSQNFNRAIGMGRNVGRGGKGRRQKGRKGGRKGKKRGGNDSDSEDDSNLSAKQLKEKQRQKRREELAKDAMVTEEEKNEQEKQQKQQKRDKMKADAELIASKKIIVIESKKIKGGKVVTLVTGLVELGMKPKRAQSEFRKQFATGVGVNVNDQGKTEVVIQGEHRYDLMKFLREKFNTPAKLLYYRLRSGLEPGFSPEGMQFPPGM